jgi:hypothetical protein
MSQPYRAQDGQCEHGDAKHRYPLQDLPGAEVRLGQIRREILDDLITGRFIVVIAHVLVVMMLRRSHAGHMVMPTVHIDVLMLAIRYMSMHVAQRRQQEAGTHNEAEHAQQGEHRAGV